MNIKKAIVNILIDNTEGYVYKWLPGRKMRMWDKFGRMEDVMVSVSCEW